MSYRQGRRREYHVMDCLEQWGAREIVRSPMSRGAADVTCLMPTDGDPQRWCVQVKTGKYLDYAAALRLIEHSKEHGCVPIFVQGAKHKALEWLRYEGTEWRMLREALAR